MKIAELLTEKINLQDFLHDFPEEMDRKEILKLIKGHLKMYGPAKEQIVLRWAEGDSLPDIARDLNLTPTQVRFALEDTIRKLHFTITHELGQRRPFHLPTIDTSIKKLWNMVKHNPDYKITTLTGGQYKIVKKTHPGPEVVPDLEVIKDKTLARKKYTDLKSEARYMKDRDERMRLHHEAEQWLQVWNKIKTKPDFKVIESEEVNEDKIKGVDGKACWKGYRYAGTEGDKDKCVKVKKAKK